MKRTSVKNNQLRRFDPAGLPLTAKEKEAFLDSIRTMDEQSVRLGFADPEETEPAILFSPLEGRK